VLPATILINNYTRLGKKSNMEEGGEEGVIGWGLDAIMAVA
jgi:hypothetical protein